MNTWEEDLGLSEPIWAGQVTVSCPEDISQTFTKISVMYLRSSGKSLDLKNKNAKNPREDYLDPLLCETEVRETRQSSDPTCLVMMG